MTEKEYYKLSDLTDILMVTRRTIYNYVKEGKLNAVKVGGQWRVTKAELDSFLKGGK